MLLNLKSQTDLSGFYIVYKGSVNLEDKSNFGISHLMEHLLCKLFDHLMDDFDIDGITYNAYTSQNEIVFYFTGLEDRLMKYIDEVLEKMTTFDITKEMFENEKKIVIEEYLDAFNDQTSNHILNFERKIFNNYNAIGELNALRNLTFLDCINFFEKQFLNPSMIINVAKNNEFKKDVFFSDLKIDKVYNYLDSNEYTLERSNVFKDKTSILYASPIINDDFAYIQFMSAYLSSGLNSPLYKEVREKNQLAYFISSSLRILGNQAVVYINTLTSNDNIDKVRESVDKVLKIPLDTKRFENMKKSFLVSLEIEDINRYNNVSRFIKDERFTITEDVINNLTIDKANEILEKYFDFSKYYISIDKTEFE